MLSLLGKVATSFQRLVKLKFQQSKKLAAVQVQRSSKCLQISTTASSGSAALARVSGGFQARALYIRGRVAWQEHRRVAGRRALFASDPPSHVMHLLKLQCIAFQCMQMRIQLCNLTARIIMNLHHLTYMRAPHIFRERASANLCKRAFQLHVDCRLPQNCSLCNVIL